MVFGDVGEAVRRFEAEFLGEFDDKVRRLTHGCIVTGAGAGWASQRREAGRMPALRFRTMGVLPS
jgi:hypothetical protein